MQPAGRWQDYLHTFASLLFQQNFALGLHPPPPPQPSPSALQQQDCEIEQLKGDAVNV
jgi:hypothetical protein